MKYYILDMGNKLQDWQSGKNESLRDTLQRAAKHYAMEGGYHSIKSIYMITHGAERVFAGKRLKAAQNYFNNELASWEHLEEQYILRGMKP